MSGRARHPALTRAFTLTEVLVVIGIIALIMAILLPTLSRAVSASHRVQCMANQRELVNAWALYWREFRGYIPLAYPDGGGDTTKANYAIDVKFIPWVIGDKREPTAAKYVVVGASSGPDWLIRAGSIYRYLRDARIYRCPEHEPNFGVNEMNISYGINNYLNGEGAPAPKILKYTQILRGATTYVTIDQIDFATWPKEEDEVLGIAYTEWAQWHLAPPAPRHGKGSCFSFVDGHVEYIKWANSDIWGMMSTYKSLRNNPANSEPDMKKLRALRGY